MSTESIIASALAAARSDGVLDGGDEGAETTEVVTEEPTEETADEGTGDGEETAEGDETTEEEEDKEGEEEETEEEGEEGKKKDDDDDEDDEELEEVDPVLGPALDKHGKENRIPHSRVVKMVGKKIQGITDIVGQALGYDKGKITTENIANALGSVQALQQYYNEMQSIEPIMRTNGKEFIARLAKANPDQYGRYAEIDEEGYTGPADKSGKHTVTADNDMPRPDVAITLPDGSKGFTYSQAGMDKRDEWLVSKAVQMATKELGKKLKPYEDERAATKEENEKNAATSANIKETLIEARGEWDGFKENEKAIQEEYNKIPQSVPFDRALRQAYNKVVVQGLKANRAKTRKEVIEEGNKAAKKVVSTKGKIVTKKDVVRDEDGEVVTGTGATIRRALSAARADGRLK